MRRATFLALTHLRKYQGAVLIERLMQAAHTARERGPLYLPSAMVIAGKPGSWPGETNVPGTGREYRADLRHHAMMFEHRGRAYGLVLMSDCTSDEELAVLAGGVFREYASGKPP